MTLQTAAPALSITPGLAILVALLGACVGSFLNVVIHRVPRRESILYPPQPLPTLRHQLALAAQPAADQLAAAARLLRRLPAADRHSLSTDRAAQRRPLDRHAVRQARRDGNAADLDAAVRRLAAGQLVAAPGPDRLRPSLAARTLCRWGLVLGLAVTALLGLSQSAATARELLADHLLAATAGLLAFEGLSALAERLIGRPALGLGDAKLAALLGAWLGWQGLWVAVMLAVLTGALLGGAARLGGLLGPREPFPFGPFLAFGGIATWVAGESWWLSQLQILSGGASL